MGPIQVLIVGAGPTGLVLALWLTRLGVAVRIIDRTAGPAAFSRALGVQARTLELYQQVGMAQAVVEGGVVAAGVNLWVSGATAARVELGGIGTGLTPFPFIVDFAQNDHERLLIGRLAALGVQVERETELVRLGQLRDRVRATIRRPDGSDEMLEVPWLAGCDGAHSAAREALGIGFPGATYDRTFYVADVEASGPATDGEVHLDLDSADLLVVFPMPGAGHVRLVGTVRGDAGAAELAFDDISGRPIEQLKLTINAVHWFSPYRVHHRVADRFRDGRAFLAGDAAHIHSPVGAQGMNTGIGDAVNLAWKLAAVVNGAAASGILDSYEPERIAFARRLVATTDRVFTLVTRPGAVASYVRTRVIPALAPRLMRLSSVRRFLFRTVSQIGVNYRGSALSDGAAGAVHGGDRLPWVRTAPGEDNFAPLASLTWQAHVHGDAHRGLADACAALQLPLHVFPWSSDAGRAGLARGALYLVRPDGYVALADPACDPQRLGAYLAERGIHAPASGG